jgi:hypothetical protein
MNKVYVILIDGRFAMEDNEKTDGGYEPMQSDVIEHARLHHSTTGAQLYRDRLEKIWPEKKVQLFAIKMELDYESAY